MERVSDDPGAFITTYEGKHNHEMPARGTNSSSEPNLQAPSSRSRAWSHDVCSEQKREASETISWCCRTFLHLCPVKSSGKLAGRHLLLKTVLCLVIQIIFLPSPNLLLLPQLSLALLFRRTVFFYVKLIFN